MDINQSQNKIIEEFSNLDEWFDKYRNLVQIGREYSPMSDDLRKEENILFGCQSNVWISAEKKGGVVHFMADSDAELTRGIISLLIRVLDGHSPQDISECELYFLDEIGLSSHLSPHRVNGLVSIVQQIKHLARD